MDPVPDPLLLRKSEPGTSVSVARNSDDQTTEAVMCICIHLLFALLINEYIYIYMSGPGSSVGIATDYGLDGPGSKPGGDEIFRLSRPALGPIKYRAFPRGKVRSGRAADHSPPSSAAVMEG